MSVPLTVGGRLAAWGEAAVGWFRSNPTAVTALSTRMGAGMLSLGQIKRYVTDNPVTAALVLWEMGDAGKAMLDELMASSPEAARVLEGLTYTADPAPDGKTKLNDLVQYQDELELITSASQMTGFSPDQLVTLKNALSLDSRFYALHRRLKEIRLR